MELTTLETVPGKTITRHLGLVQGSTVRSKHAGKDILAGLKNFVGGELKSYTALLNESRTEAIDRMVEQARAAGANAVVTFVSRLRISRPARLRSWPTVPRSS